MAWGITLAEAEDAASAAVWPDNLAAVNVFIAMSTQWRSAGFGATGLDYGPLPGVMRMCGMPRRDWHDTFESIRILEEAALTIMRAKR